MDFGEQLAALEWNISEFARKQFQINDIPESIQRLVMEAVYGQFQGRALEKMITSRIQYAGGDDGKVRMSEEEIRDTVKAMEAFYNGEGENGGTADRPA